MQHEVVQANILITKYSMFYSRDLFLILCPSLREELRHHLIETLAPKLRLKRFSGSHGRSRTLTKEVKLLQMFSVCSDRRVAALFMKADACLRCRASVCQLGGHGLSVGDASQSSGVPARGTAP